MASARIRGPIGRRLLFAVLYFSEGAPIGYIWWAMPTRLRAAGMPVDEVTALTSLLALPWAFKFLWAPAVDALRGSRWGYRAWISAAQCAMGLTLLPLAILPLESLRGAVWWVLVGHAVAAATQDVAIDALAINTLPHEERGRATGWMQAGMLVGRALFGGLALAAERWIGAQAVVVALLACIWLTMAVVWLAPPIAGWNIPLRQRVATFANSLRRVVVQRSTWIGAAIALTAGACFETIGGLLGPYLLDRGLSSESIGWFLALPVVLCMIAGSLLGGWTADRMGHRLLALGSVLALAAWMVLLVAADAWMGVRGTGLMAMVAPIYLLTGTLTAASYALFMDLTDPAVGGTQFSAYMGATNLCEVWAVALGGSIAAKRGYGSAFAIAAVLSLLAVPFLWLLFRRPVRPSAEVR